ncbi:hypothetical protein CPB84DRAFT_1771109 [Gymnopilus junonius]|uniref:Uncharacterized protein n=1 Tax=Gymnopilus junonius TaxID=109634 RepID=A0A9P5TQY9_GYMJU|nr:hypothetical protein CPB84DRAFT_1771109 [Gymnopilus junonius]
MHSHLAKFLENNDCPPQSVTAKVKGINFEPVQEIRKIDAETKFINKTLEVLEAECSDLQQLILEYDIISSPTRGLLPDILHDIPTLSSNSPQSGHEQY